MPRAGQPAAAGSLLVGAPGPGRLAFRGQVGSGISAAAGRELAAALTALRQPQPPFAGPLPPGAARAARWARPVLTCEVAYAGLTSAGLLRHPVWRGLRPGAA